MIIRKLSRLLGRRLVALPERSALDEESLRLGAALAVIKQRGDLVDLAGSRTDTLALITTAVKRGLIAWDLSGERYDLTALGEAHLEAYRPAGAAAPTPNPAAASSATATAGAAIAIAVTSLGGVVATVRRSIGARSRSMLSGKVVTAVAGGAAVIGMVIGASIGSTRLDDRTARSDVPPKAANASASAPAGTAPHADGGAEPAVADRTASVDQHPQPDSQDGPAVALSDDHGAVVPAGGMARGGQALAGGEADAAPPPLPVPAKPVAETTKNAANAAPAATQRRASAAPDPVTPQAQLLVAAPGADAIAVVSAGGRRTQQQTARRDPAAPADRAGPMTSAEPVAAQAHLPARPSQHAAVSPERDAPARSARASGVTARASARKRAMDKIVAALDRHRAAAAAEGPPDATQALSLQEAQPLDHRRPPSRAAQPATKSADPAPRARPPITAAEPPPPAQGGPHNLQADAGSPDRDPAGRDRTVRDPTVRDPRVLRPNRAPPDEWSRWPQPNDDCDLADAARGPYGWYAGPYWPGVVVRRYAPYGRYADGRVAEDRRLYLVYPPAWQYR